MVIVLKQNISDSEKENIKEFLGEHNFKTNEIVGQEQAIIAAVGRGAVEPRDVQSLAGVENVIPISKPFKLASREFNPQNTIVEIKNSFGQKIRIGGQRLVSIAGPCLVEDENTLMEIAKIASNSGACLLHGDAFKPRTSPYAFSGLGEEALKLLKKAGNTYGLPVVSEIISEDDIPLFEKYDIDVYQIGARNMQNFDLLKAVGKLNKPVILKRGYACTIEELLMSAEYLLSSGTDKVILCERGIRTFESATKNTLDLSAIPVLRSITHLPILVDPSHAVGIRDKISPMALASIASGADGIIIEFHTNPSKARSDANQALTPEMFDKLMHDVEALAPVVGKSVVHIRKDLVKKSAENSKVKDSEKLTCAYSGKRGAYAEQAVSRYFDENAEAIPCSSFKEVFKTVLEGKADYGMIPIENSLGGSVYDNYDNLSLFEDVSIVGAMHLRIQHALLAPKGTKITDIKRIYSHPQGFAQCEKIIDSYNWEKIATVSTATGAKMVADFDSKENAAIASSITAGYYNLEILQDDIQDDPRDYTRFVIIAANHISQNKTLLSKNPNMATFMFSTENKSGSLCEALGVFQKYGLNLTRLESRPIAGQPWHYWFYADAELKETEHQNIEYVQKVLNELKSVAEEIRLLGVYSEAGYNI